MTIEMVSTCCPPQGIEVPTPAGLLNAVALAFDGAGCLTEVSDSLCTRLDQPREALLGRPLTSLFAAAETDTLATWFASAACDGSMELWPAVPSADPNPLLATLLRLGPGQPGRAVLNIRPPSLEEMVRLRCEKAQLAGIVEAAKLGLWQWNVQTGETIFDARWAEIAGYGLEELQPISITTWTDLCHPEDLERSEATLQRHFAGETDWYEMEARIRHKSGRWVWIRNLGRVRSWTADGKPEWMSGVHRDIDEWKSRETRLRRAQDLLERAGMLAGLGSWEVDLVSGEISWSEETCRIHGVAPGYCPTLEESINFYAPEAQPVVRAAVQKGIEQGTPWDFELPLIRQDGEQIWVRAVGEVVFEDGAPVRLSGAFQNITARKETEAQLAEAAAEARRARDRLNTLADNAPGALFEHRESTSGLIDLPYFSARLPDILGVTREQMLADGAAAGANIHPDDAAMLSKAIIASREGMTPLDVRYRLNHPTRGLRWLHLSSMPYRQPDGAVIWHGSVFDVTEESEMVDALRIAHERLNMLAENVPGALFELRRELNGHGWFPYFTQKFPDLLGVRAEDMDGNPATLLANVHEEDREKLAHRLDASRASLQLLELRMRVRDEHSATRWLHLWAAPFARPDGTMTWFGKVVDISDRLAVEAQAASTAAEVRRAHARLNSITDIAPVGLFEYRRAPDGQTEFPYASARFNELLGVDRADLLALGGAVFDRVVPEDREKMHERTAESMRSLSPWRMRFRYLHPKRGLIWLSASSTPVRQIDGSVVWTGGLFDVTADVARETELEHAWGVAEKMRARNEHLALHDGLTGLPNRRYFDRRLEERLQSARAGATAPDCALVQVDIDHFKHVNDTLGHEAGDQALCHLADVLRGCLRPGDFAARLGGMNSRFCWPRAAHRPRQRRWWPICAKPCARRSNTAARPAGSAPRSGLSAPRM